MQSSIVLKQKNQVSNLIVLKPKTKPSVFMRKTFGAYTLSIILDAPHLSRFWNEETGKYEGLIPAMIRISCKGKTAWLPTNCQFSHEDFSELCRIENSSSRARTKERALLHDCMERVLEIMRELEKNRRLTFQNIRNNYLNIADKDESIFDVWNAVIAMQKKHTTKTSYAQTLRRFEADCGKKIDFQDIDNKLVSKWREKMIKDGLSETTAAIYLRTFRAIINKCVESGKPIMGATSEIFKGLKLSETKQRNGEFLDSDTMQRIYDFWLAEEAKDENGKELFAPREKRAIFRNLAFFLFSYLCNGMNIADLLELEYNKDYFASNGTELSFYRKKVRDKTGDRSRVCFPIDLPPIQAILERHAMPPRLNSRVFDFMPKGLDSAREADYVKRANRIIRQTLEKVYSLIGIDENIRVTATFARHSFASNLNAAGVPVRYIDAAMGHSRKGDVISHYLADLPHQTKVEYNSKLLPMMSETSRREKLLKAGFSEEQIQVILSL